MRWLFFFSLPIAAAAVAFGAQLPRYAGSPVARVFTDRDIPGGARVRMVLVQPDGLIYAGNVLGLAQYDGVSWKMIRGTEDRIIHNVARGAGERLWYSSRDEFGVIEPDAAGEMTGRALHTGLPPEDREVGHVLHMAVNGRDAYFATQGLKGFLAHVDARDQVHEIMGDGRCTNVFVADGAVYMTTPAHIWRVAGDTLQPAPEAEALRPLGVIALWPRTEGGWWVVSPKGLHVWRDGQAPLISADVTNFIGADIVACGCAVGDGTIALGTERHGLLIVAADGHILAHYDESDGLGNTANRIEAVTPDAEGGLWLSLFGGVTRIQAITPSALHRRTGDVHSRVESFGFHRGQLYAATTQGVYVSDPATGGFRAVPGADQDSWSLVSTEDGLIVAGSDLRLLHNDGHVEIIEPERLLFRSALRLPQDPDHLLASTGPGQLRVYHHENGRWRFEGKFSTVHDAFFDLALDRHGHLWAAARNFTEIVRLDLRNGPRLDTPVESVGPALGLPVAPGSRGYVRCFMIEGEAEASSALGLWRHDPAIDRMVREDRIAGLDTMRWSIAFPLSDGSLWLANNRPGDTAALAHRTGPGVWRLERMPATGLEATAVRQAADEPATHTLWVGYEELASIDLDWKGPRFAPPVARLRFAAAGTQTLWAGAGPLPQPSLPFAQNSLRFMVAAPSYWPDAFGDVKTEYRTRLEGFDPAWSEWSHDTRRDYSRLPPGNFSLRLQARDHFGHDGPVAKFDFTVLPPWWRTWWAYALDVLAVVGGLAWIVAARTRQLRARARRLEGLVAARTAQLAQQNVELTRLLQLELDEKIAARLAEERARLHMLRYQLNPHFLFNTLASISSAISPGRSAARTMIDRLTDFCRLTLHRPDDSDWTTLAEELKLLRAYLDIEHSRWGELLEIAIEAPSGLEAERLPHFLLLPLVENALKYGRATSPDRVGIRISVLREDDALVLQIANTGEWIDPKNQKRVASLGVGLENLRERLARYYPRAHTLEVAPEPGWVVVTLRLFAQRSGARPGKETLVPAPEPVAPA